MKTSYDHFLEKKIIVYAETPFSKRQKFIGVCSFIGMNTLLNRTQVTIDRTPIFIEDLSTVREYTD